MPRKGAAKIEKKAAAASGDKKDGAKRRRKARTDSYASYIYKVLKQVRIEVFRSSLKLVSFDF
jgi:hypothetical protein